MPNQRNYSRPLFAGLMLICALMVCVEPAVANKFTTISGGVVGSNREKIAFIHNLLIALGGIFLLGAVLAVVIPHHNPLYLNYGNWKQSAIFMSIVGVILLGTGLAIG